MSILVDKQRQRLSLRSRFPVRFLPIRHRWYYRFPERRGYSLSAMCLLEPNKCAHINISIIMFLETETEEMFTKNSPNYRRYYRCERHDYYLSVMRLLLLLYSTKPNTNISIMFLEIETEEIFTKNSPRNPVLKFHAASLLLQALHLSLLGLLP